MPRHGGLKTRKLVDIVSRGDVEKEVLQVSARSHSKHSNTSGADDVEKGVSQVYARSHSKHSNTSQPAGHGMEEKKIIKYYHGGYFIFSPHRAYVHGSLKEKEYPVDLLSYFYIVLDLKKYCAIDALKEDKFYYLKPDSTVSNKDGLVEITDCKDVKDMLTIYSKYKGKPVEIYTLIEKYSIEPNNFHEAQDNRSNSVDQLNENVTQANGEDGDIEKSPESNKTSKRKTRGPTRCLKIFGLESGQKLPIQFDEDNQPVGDNSTDFVWFLGQTVRSRTCCPLQVEGWKEIGMDAIDHMWNIVLEKFTFEQPEEKKEYVIGHMQELYRGYRHKMKNTYFDSKSTYQLRLRNKPKHVDVNDWKYLVSLWSGPAFQERSKKNKTNRSKRSMTPYTGTKSYARLRHEMEKKNGKKPSRVDVYIESRKRKRGKEVDPLSQEVIAKFEDLKKQREEGQNSLNDDDIFCKVLGPEKNGYLRAYGPGKSITEYFGARPTKLELLKQVEASRIEANERVREANERVSEIEKQMTKKFEEMNKQWEEKFQMFMSQGKQHTSNDCST